MGRGRILIWTYYCDVCRSEEEEVLIGDPDGHGDYVYDQAAADRAIRSERWMIRRDGTVLCPSCAGRETS